MRKLTILLCIIYIYFSGASALYAQTVYIVDAFKVTMRTGPSNENKIISMLPSGTKLEIMKEQDGWLLTRTIDEKEGWVLKQFTSGEIPKATQIDQLHKKLENVSKKLRTSKESASTLDKKNKKLSQALSLSQKELNKISSDYSTLTADSKNVLNLKKKYEENSKNLFKVTSEIDQLDQENAELRSANNIRWFLSGAGVVAGSFLVGFIIGKTRRARKRGASLFG